MAISLVFDSVAVTQEQDDHVFTQVTDNGGQRLTGLLSHHASPTENGFRVIPTQGIAEDPTVVLRRPSERRPTDRWYPGPAENVGDSQSPFVQARPRNRSSPSPFGPGTLHVDRRHPWLT